MKKKLGPLPVWVWVAIAAIGGFALYRYEKSKSEGLGVEEGFFPTQGIPAEGAETGASSGGGGIGELAGQLRELEEAGLVPAGSIAAERPFPPEPPLPAETPAWWEEVVGQIVGERLLGGGGQSKGKKSKKGPNAGQAHHANHTNHQPGHAAKTDHRTAAHPKQRIGVGAGHPAGGGGGKKGGGGGGKKGGGGGGKKGGGGGGKKGGGGGGKKGGKRR